MTVPSSAISWRWAATRPICLRRVGVEHCELPLEAVGANGVVAAQQLDVRRRRRGDGGGPARRGTEVLGVADGGDSWIGGCVLLGDLERTVLRCVVDDHHLPVRLGLGQHRIQRFGEESLGGERRHADGDSRLVRSFVLRVGLVECRFLGAAAGRRQRIADARARSALSRGPALQQAARSGNRSRRSGSVRPWRPRPHGDTRRPTTRRRARAPATGDGE